MQGKLKTYFYRFNAQVRVRFCNGPVLWADLPINQQSGVISVI